MARKIITFTGNNGAGAISIAGVKPGDQVLSIMFTGGGIAPGTTETSAFAAFVVTEGQLLQNASTDFSIYTFAGLLERKVMLP